MKITVHESRESIYKLMDDLAEETRIELDGLLLDETDVEDGIKSACSKLIEDAFDGKYTISSVSLWPADDPNDGILYTADINITDGDKHKFFAKGELEGEYDGDDGLFRIHKVYFDPMSLIDE